MGSYDDPGPRVLGVKIIWARLAILLWIILAVVVSVKSVVQPNRKTVYPIFASASQHWWEDAPLHANYNLDGNGLDVYRYSLTFAIAFTPFYLLPDQLGCLLWNLIGIGLFFFAIRRMALELLPGKWPPYRVGMLLCLALVGSVRGIWAGQSNGLLFAMVVFAAIALMHDRNKTAAWLLAGAVYIKIWPLAVAMLLIVCWPRRILPHFVVAMIVLGLVPYLTRPVAVVNVQYAQWYSSVFEVHQERWPGIRDFWTVLEYLHLTGWRPLYYLLMLSTAAVVCLWVLYQKKRNVGSLFAGTWDTSDLSTNKRAVGNLLTVIVASWIGWQLLFGPGSERLTYQIIAPPATWALLAAWSENRLRPAALAAWLMTGILGIGAVERALLPYWPGSNTILPLGAIVFLVWLAIHETKKTPERELSPEDSPAC